MTTDAEHLKWIHDRLRYVYKESPNYDYMIRLQNIIKKLESTSEDSHRAQALEWARDIRRRMKGYTNPELRDICERTATRLEHYGHTGKVLP